MQHLIGPELQLRGLVIIVMTESMAVCRTGTREVAKSSVFGKGRQQEKNDTLGLA